MQRVSCAPPLLRCEPRGSSSCGRATGDTFGVASGTGGAQSTGPESVSGGTLGERFQRIGAIIPRSRSERARRSTGTSRGAAEPVTRTSYWARALPYSSTSCSRVESPLRVVAGSGTGTAAPAARRRRGGRSRSAAAPGPRRKAPAAPPPARPDQSRTARPVPSDRLADTSTATPNRACRPECGRAASASSPRTGTRTGERRCSSPRRRARRDGAAARDDRRSRHCRSAGRALRC